VGVARGSWYPTSRCAFVLSADELAPECRAAPSRRRGLARRCRAGRGRQGAPSVLSRDTSVPSRDTRRVDLVTKAIAAPRAALRGGSCAVRTGGVLLSQALASQVPSALRGLTSLFGMGRGVSPSLKPPENRERPRVSGSFKTAQRHNEYHSPLRGSNKIRQALEPLVPVSFERYRPSRSGLSTWWSTRALTPSRGWENSS
jgi:hypothetical protein